MKQKSVAGLARLQICALTVIAALSCVFYGGQTLAGTKLVVDDGRFQGSSWVRQLMVTADDRFLLVSDFENGVRTYDITTGSLVNSLVGHSLEGDSYYDAQNNIFLTTGDRKIKIWDFQQQKLIKTINQTFHSQFMTNVYIDSKKKYVFAQDVKYSFDTKQPVKRYNFKGTTFEMNDPETFIKVCFYHDRYYMFNSRSGEVKAFDSFSDELIKNYQLDDYQKGINNYFDYRSGQLFISHKDGVRIVDITNGASDYAKFDRSQAYDNLGNTSSYGISADGNYLVAGSDQGVGLVVLKKIEVGKGFANNTREVLRQNLVVTDIRTLHRSNKVIYTTGSVIHLLDLETLKPVWQTEARILGFRNIFLAPDGKELYITMGSQPKVNRHWFGRTFPYKFEQYFDDVDANWGTIKPELRVGDLPEELVPMWRERARTARLHLDQGMALELVPEKLPFPVKGTANTTYNPVEGTVTSPSGRYAVEVKHFKPSPVYEGNRRLGQAPDLGVIYHVEYSSDERYMAMGGAERRVAVVDLKTGKTLPTLNGESYITSITFSPDNQYLFTGSLKNEILMWRLKDGKLLQRFLGSNGEIADIEITPDGKTLLSISTDGGLRFWGTTTGKLLLSAFIIDPTADSPQAGKGVREDYDWVVVTPDGRFDTNNLEESERLHWIREDEPLRPLPLEIFMRDYYEPRLMSRLLAGEQLKPVRRLDDLNLVQPEVKIVKAEQGDSPEKTSVTVEVSKSQSSSQREGKDAVMQTGAFDLRLYREGQLVGQWPEPEESTFKSLDLSSDEELKAWQKATEIKLDDKGKGTKTFTVRLPRRKGLKELEFSAYSFNEDRVKSETARVTYQLPAGLKAVTGRSYIIVVGVSDNQDLDWRLAAAASDAKLMQRTLISRLKDSAAYEKVLAVPLITLPPVVDFDDEESTNERKMFIRPTKENIKAVMDILAGREVAPARLEQIPAELRRDLRPVRPEDVVILSFSSHGVTDQNGEFSMLPYDLGRGSQGKITPELLRRGISSQELSLWLSAVDSERMFLIIDACHSAAAVAVEGFKPGPMGNPGLGQLSYDKRMPILVATQATDSAWAKGGYSLLTFALAQEGIGEQMAAQKGSLTLMEALRYAERRVPKLYEEMLAKEQKSVGQEPKLFHFIRPRYEALPEVTLVKQ